MSKYFEWNEEKNAILKLRRDVGFEDVVEAWNSGDILEIVDHPNKARYPNQKLATVIIRDYVYLVPLVEDEKKYFLKTIFPSRKATKKYLGRKVEDK